MNSTRIQTLRGVMLASILAVLFLALPARAQRFEETFGDSCTEYGIAGQPVSSGGYISVGYSSSPSAGSSDCSQATFDIYVVRLNDDGSLAWANTYDIGGNDMGMDIRECANGDFIVVAYTDNSNTGCLGRGDIALLRLSSSGAVNWINTYGTEDYEEFPYRVVETTTSAGGHTSRGDFVVAGFQAGGSTRTDGLLMRVDANGSLIWMKTYGDKGDEAFRGLVESTVGTGASDLIADGQSNSFNSRGRDEGFVIRVSGLDGKFSTSVHGAALYGDTNEVVFNGVDELTSGSDSTALVYCGYACRNANSDRDIYVVKSKPRPCDMIADVRYGDNHGAAEEAFSIRQIHAPSSSKLNDGNLILTGASTVRNPSSIENVFLLEMTTGLVLVPASSGVGYKLYGVTADKATWAEPVVGASGQRTDGFYITGVTGSPALIPSGTGPQMYLIKTDNMGVTRCHDSDYTPRRTVPKYQGRCRDIKPVDIGKECEPKEKDEAQDWIDTLCNDSLRQGDGGDGSDGNGTLGELRNGGLREHGGRVQVNGAIVKPHAIVVRTAMPASASRPEAAMEVVPAVGEKSSDGPLTQRMHEQQP